ncbi:MAG: hypothetical protein MR936_07675 [Eubacterium sp.]|nr:hypothetical protein [Eubacterium sp.]
MLKKGDEVLNVTNDYVAIKRKHGAVDIIPLIKEEYSWRGDSENIVAIGYGDNTVTYENENGVQITNFQEVMKIARTKDNAVVAVIGDLTNEQATQMTKEIMKAKKKYAPNGMRMALREKEYCVAQKQGKVRD